MRNDLSEILQQELGKELIIKEYLRGDFILKSGENASKIYWIKKGAVRVTFGDKDIITVRLGYENSIIASIPAFFTDTPSLFDIEVLRKTSVAVIEKKDLSTLVSSHPEFKNYYIRLLEDLIRQQSERELDLMITSPQDRFQRVFDRSPKLFQEIPLKYIAHYLRMTPETLSRIMKS
ncbi:Crp/Fnr family transcriptional regulator [Flammeovirga pacifica]|uniref:Cyclic nucleotide-binding domain-containing protein n=1 Tax=Flammeovirga pacifica TaxID=915059 RepID=A0A1S1YW97_FLAPC|nr:Crp/Fnr family transcriptional regulator [Flammeovirga pacifica]OHX65085.1 hypothetical protein NH26_01325 [Flammeovirga pacifica]